MIESLTGTHADWIVAIARVVLGIIFFAHALRECWGGMAGPALRAACARSPNICTFCPLWPHKPIHPRQSPSARQR